MSPSTSRFMAAIVAIACSLMALPRTSGLMRPAWRVRSLQQRTETTGFQPRTPPLSPLAASTSVEEVTEVSEEGIRTWFLKTQGRRPEVFLSESASKVAVVADAWKSVLVSLRVLESDPTTRDYTAVFAFPQCPVEGSADTVLADYAQVASAIERSLNESAVLFQPSFLRRIEFHVKPGAGAGGKPVLLLSLDTRRSKAETLDYEDIDLYVPPVEDVLTNDIENFPFPTIFDFISEINRPPEPFTMSELRFNFKVQDFKYDLAKMAKKKNPQDVVDTINCKLTRLQNWRDVLSADTGNLPDPFSETAEWSERVKLKYQSLKALAQTDPKRALETQYDKKATFIKIIDLWSDRLKRAFKFIYQSQRAPEDFITPIMQSRWRNEVLNTTRLFAQVPFLDLEGPSFQPGAPTPLFREDRELLWTADYSVEAALAEMLVWGRRVEAAHAYAGSSAAGLGPVALHTYSRGFVTERALFDFWQGLTRWLGDGPAAVADSGDSGDKAARVPAGATLRVNPDAVLAAARTVPPAPGAPAAAAAAPPLPSPAAPAPADHTEDFLTVLKRLNTFTREQSLDQAKSVKELYRDWFHSGRELAEWWTTTVRNLDLVADMTGQAISRQQPWSEVMTGVVDYELARDNGIAPPSETSVQAGENAEAIADDWTGYRPVMQCAELLESYLPWRGITPPSVTPEGSEAIGKMGAFRTETVHVALAPPAPASASGEAAPVWRASGGYLLVLPRYFRGLHASPTASEELSAFLEFARVLSTDVKRLGGLLGLPAGTSLEVVPLHPQMVAQNGAPDYARRAPHPAVLVRVVTA